MTKSFVYIIDIRIEEALIFVVTLVPILLKIITNCNLM